MRARTTVLVCAGLLLAAAGAVALIYSTEPEAQRVGATKETAMLVDVVTVERGDHRPTIVALGTVEAASDVMLAPRVAGEVVERAPGFEPGSFVARGEVLVRIDPADYEHALALRESDLRRALADLELEEGRQEVARRDFELLDREVSDESQALVLRRPQLATAQANVQAARAEVEQARLELERATVEAPFDAHVLRRDVDVGSQVAAGEPLGRLVGVDVYWVVATVPQSKLRRIAFAQGQGKDGSLARVRHPAAWPPGVERTGRVERLIGTLDADTRLARVLVTVPDPLLHRSDDGEGPALMLGAFVEVSIQGETLSDVVKLGRDLVRKGDTAWVAKDGALRIRELDVVFRDSEHAYVRAGLETGDRVVVTDLTTVVDGAPLRREGADGGADGGAEEGAEEGSGEGAAEEDALR